MKKTLFAPALGFVALASAQAAQAQNVCVNAEDAGDAVVYAMPLAYEAAKKACKNELAETSFLRGDKGAAFIETFRERQDASWPGTVRMLKIFIAQSGEGADDGMAQMLNSMEDDALRPFVDALGGQMLAQEIKPDSCATIDKAAELMSPLPADNVSGLVSLILQQVDLKNPPVCGVDGTVKVIPEGPMSEDDTAAQSE